MAHQGAHNPPFSVEGSLDRDHAPLFPRSVLAVLPYLSFAQASCLLLSSLDIAACLLFSKPHTLALLTQCHTSWILPCLSSANLAARPERTRRLRHPKLTLATLATNMTAVLVLEYQQSSLSSSVLCLVCHGIFWKILLPLLTIIIGAWFPVFARRHQGIGVPEWAFFGAKYFGSGVIIATAFIHVRLLLSGIAV